MKKLIYIRMPRTGSTSLFRLGLSQMSVFHGKSLGYWGRGYNRCNFEYKAAHLVKDRVGSDYDNSLVFSTVRNPWSRAVSIWKHKSFKNVGDFSVFCRMINRGKLPPMKNWHSQECFFHLYEDIDKCLVDFVVRFENLQEDFNTICDKIGIPRKELPHKNKSKHKHYTEYYDDETRQIVEEQYRKDIEYFGYKFGEQT